MRRSFRMGCPASAVLVSPEAALGKVQVSQWIFRLLAFHSARQQLFFLSAMVYRRPARPDHYASRADKGLSGSYP